MTFSVVHSLVISLIASSTLAAPVVAEQKNDHMLRLINSFLNAEQQASNKTVSNPPRILETQTAPIASRFDETSTAADLLFLAPALDIKLNDSPATSPPTGAGASSTSVFFEAVQRSDFWEEDFESASVTPTPPHTEKPAWFLSPRVPVHSEPRSWDFGNKDRSGASSPGYRPKSSGYKNDSPMSKSSSSDLASVLASKLASVRASRLTPAELDLSSKSHADPIPWYIVSESLAEFTTGLRLHPDFQESSSPVVPGFTRLSVFPVTSSTPTDSVELWTPTTTLTTVPPWTSNLSVSQDESSGFSPASITSSTCPPSSLSSHLPVESPEISVSHPLATSLDRIFELTSVPPPPHITESVPQQSNLPELSLQATLVPDASTSPDVSGSLGEQQSLSSGESKPAGISTVVPTESSVLLPTLLLPILMYTGISSASLSITDASSIITSGVSEPFPLVHESLHVLSSLPPPLAIVTSSPLPIFTLENNTLLRLPSGGVSAPAPLLSESFGSSTTTLSEFAASVSSPAVLDGQVSLTLSTPTFETSSVAAVDGASAEQSATSSAPVNNELSVSGAAPVRVSESSSSSNWVPTQIIADTVTTSLLTQQTNNPKAQTSGLPRAITPGTGGPQRPDYGVVTVGFKEELNYPFVVRTSLASVQILTYLPPVLTEAFSDQRLFADVRVNSLVPYTAENIDYVITVARVDFPSSAIPALQMLVLSADSKLYNNPDAICRNLALLIDNRIPLTRLNSDSQANAPDQGNGSMDSAEAPTSMKSGVAGGVVAGASVGTIAYMALMVLFFKKYQKTKNSVELPPSDSESNLEGSIQSPPLSHDSSGSRPPISNPRVVKNLWGWHY